MAVRSAKLRHVATYAYYYVVLLRSYLVVRSTTVAT